MKVTPVPIPNTTVKLHRADGTAGEALWESRKLPGLYSAVAQWWSTRLLTDRLEVRALSAEPRKKLLLSNDKRGFFQLYPFLGETGDIPYGMISAVQMIYATHMREKR